VIDNPRAYTAFIMAHKFLQEFNIRWLPVDPFEIIRKKENWTLQYTHNLAAALDMDEKYLHSHVLRSEDGMSAYDPQTKQYYITLNGDGKKPFSRLRWTAMHEIAHICLGHLDSPRDTLPAEEYKELEFEANVFTAEALASKWVMREMGVADTEDIALICGISNVAALKQQAKVTAKHGSRPKEARAAIRNFEQYLKEICICKSPDDFGELQRFASLNKNYTAAPADGLAEAKRCDHCGNVSMPSPHALFCMACGKPLRTHPQKRNAHCGHINHARALFCEFCGNKVYRTRQGLCFEECEII